MRRAAAGRGHELNNHTLFHPCSKSLPEREWVATWLDLDTITVDELKQHIVLANTMLHAIDGRVERTLTAPCGDLHAAGGDHLAVSLEAHEQLLQHLADNRDVYWVDTFVTIMQ